MNGIIIKNFKIIFIGYTVFKGVFPRKSVHKLVNRRFIDRERFGLFCLLLPYGEIHKPQRVQSVIIAHTAQEVRKLAVCAVLFGLYFNLWIGVAYNPQRERKVLILLEHIVRSGNCIIKLSIHPFIIREVLLFCRKKIGGVFCLKIYFFSVFCGYFPGNSCAFWNGSISCTFKGFIPLSCIRRIVKRHFESNQRWGFNYVQRIQFTFYFVCSKAKINRVYRL